MKKSANRRERATRTGPIGVERSPTAAELEAVGLAPEIARWLAGYLPRKAHRVLWETRVRAFVIPFIVLLNPSSRPSAESFVWALSLLARWCIDQHIPLDPEIALDPATVERFISNGLKDASRATRHTARSILRRIGPKLTKKAPWEAPPERIRHRTLAPPYTDTEERAVLIDAARQSTSARRRASQAVLALGAGAGITGKPSMEVRGTDVVSTPDAVIVQVGGRLAREVPVLARYEKLILALAKEAGAEPLVGGQAKSKNKVSRILGRYEAGPNRPRLSPSRARSSWLLHHVRAGTRLPELAKAAGLKGVSVLNELLELVEAMDEPEARRMLRGPG